jgi:hypothetical protein
LAEKFWIVIGVGDRLLSIRYKSKARAIEDAERLAKQHPGMLFTVMESLRTAVSRRMQWIENDEVEQGGVS